MTAGSARRSALLFARDRFSLPVSLLALRVLARVADVRGPWSDWAHAVLGLDAAALQRWSRRAWWGRDASHAVRLRLDDRLRCHEARALIEPTDWTRLDALRGRRGVLLAAGHVGPSQAAADCVTRHCAEALFLFWHRHPGIAGEQRVLVAEPASRRWIFVEASERLRNGGVVFWAADDPDVRPLQVEMFGTPVRLSRDAATLAHLSGAATLPIAATWEKGRIRVVLGEALEPASTEPAEWEREWLSGYARFLERIVAADAANLRLDGGVWAALTRRD